MSLNLNKQNIFYFIIFCIFLTIYIVKIVELTDIYQSDEIVYINSGIYFTFPLENNYVGPIYSIWYKLLYILLFKNALLTYFFNIHFVAIGISILLFIIGSSVARNKLFALLIALIYLFSSINIFLLPRISHFVVLVLLVGLIFLRKDKGFNDKLFIIGILAILIGYIRPEYYLTYCFITAIFLFQMIYPIFLKRPTKYFLILFALGISFYFLFRGMPFSNRSFDAFVQHYVRNFTEENNLPKPINFVEELSIFRSAYNLKSNSFSEAFFDEPLKFLWHCLQNIKKTIIYTKDFYFTIFLGGISHFISPVYFKWLVLGIGTLIGLSINWKLFLKNIVTDFDKDLFFSLGLIYIPTLISLILIYPREHYLIILFVPFLLVLLYSIDKIELKEPVSKFKNSTFTIFFSILLITSTLHYQKQNSHYKEMYVLGKQLSNTNRLVVVEDYFNKVFYGNKIEYPYSKYDFKKPFSQFVVDNNINFIHVNESLGLLSLYRNKSFKDFDLHYSDLGFLKIKVFKGYKDFLYVKRNLVTQKELMAFNN